MGRAGSGNGIGGGSGEGGKVVLGKKPELFEVWWDEEGDEKGYGYDAGGERPLSEISEKGKRVSFAAKEGLDWQSLMVRTIGIAVENDSCTYDCIGWSVVCSCGAC